MALTGTRHTCAADGVRIARRARPRRLDVSARRVDVHAISIITKGGIDVSDVGGPDGDGRRLRRRRLVAGVAIVVAGGYDHHDPFRRRVLHGRVEGGAQSSAQTHVSDALSFGFLGEGGLAVGDYVVDTFDHAGRAAAPTVTEHLDCTKVALFGHAISSTADGSSDMRPDSP